MATTKTTAKKRATTTAKMSKAGTGAKSSSTRATARKRNTTTNRSVRRDESEKPGFTIIEVVLVLAIAGLIFLMVFIALPQLQRAQRDTQRRNDLSRLSAAITQYQTNNNGKIPNQTGVSGEDFIKKYIIDEFVDPDGSNYTIEFDTKDNIETINNKTEMDHTIYVVNYAACDGEDIIKSNNVRDYAVRYKMEGSGVYCQDSGGTVNTSTD